MLRKVQRTQRYEISLCTLWETPSGVEGRRPLPQQQEMPPTWLIMDEE
ncbi:hypothetical protein LR066_04740 [candidate division WOR-3 bacterium]|nr:hypothetical protein [candidate division WOR-3 bacterium]